MDRLVDLILFGLFTAYNFRYRRVFNSWFLKMKKSVLFTCVKIEIFFFQYSSHSHLRDLEFLTWIEIKTIFRVYLTKKNQTKYNNLQNLKWFIVTLFILNENIILLKLANQHPDMQIRQILYSPHNVCPRMLAGNNDAEVTN